MSSTLYFDEYEKLRKSGKLHPNRNCVYYCLYGDISYKQLLKISVMSLSKFLPKENIIIFSQYEIEELEEYCNIIKTEFPKGFASSMAYRLILGKNLLNEYNKVIHLDVDTIVAKDIQDIFNQIQSNQISFATENIINPDKVIGEYWAGPLLSEEEKNNYKDINSICCGVFGFDMSMYLKFEDIYNFIVECENQGFKGICCDQHAFTAYVLRNNLYNFNLQKYVTHNTHQIDLNSDIRIYHFAGGVTSKGKYEIMKKLSSMSVQ